ARNNTWVTFLKKFVAYYGKKYNFNYRDVLNNKSLLKEAQDLYCGTMKQKDPNFYKHSRCSKSKTTRSKSKTMRSKTGIKECPRGTIRRFVLPKKKSSKTGKTIRAYV